MTRDDKDGPVASENIFLIQRTLTKLMQDSSKWPVTQVTPNFSLEELQRFQRDKPSSFYLSPGMYEAEVIENTASCLIAGAPFGDTETATAVNGDGRRVFVNNMSQSDMAIFQQPIKINSHTSLVIHGVWFTNRVEVTGKGPVYFSQCLFGATAWSSDVLASSSSLNPKFASVRVAVDGECCFSQCDFDNICGMAGTVGVNEVPVITACGCTKLNIFNSSFCGPGVVSTVLVLLDTSRLEADSISVVRCGGYGLVVRDKSRAVIFRSVFGHNGNGVWVRDKGNLEIRDSSIEAVYNGQCSLFLSNHGRCFAQYCSFSAWATHPYSVGRAIVAARDHAHVSLSVCELFWKEAIVSDKQQRYEAREELLHHSASSAIASANCEKSENFGFCHVLLRGRSEATLTRCILRMPIAQEPSAEFAAVGVFLQGVSQISSFPLYAVENTLVYEFRKGGNGVETKLSVQQESGWKGGVPLMFGLVLPCILDGEEEKNLRQLATMWVLTNQFVESNEQPLKDASLICCSYDTYCELTGKSPFASSDNTSETVDVGSDSFSTNPEVLEKDDFRGSSSSGNNNKNSNKNNNNFDELMKDSAVASSGHGGTNTHQKGNMSLTQLPLASAFGGTFDSTAQEVPRGLGRAGSMEETNDTFFRTLKETESGSTSLTSFSEEEEECDNSTYSMVRADSEVLLEAVKPSKAAHDSSSNTEPFLQKSFSHKETAQNSVVSPTQELKLEAKTAIVEESNATSPVASRAGTQVSFKTNNESASHSPSLDTDEKRHATQSLLKRKTQYTGCASVDMRSARCRRGVNKKGFAECQSKAMTSLNSRNGTSVVSSQHNGNKAARQQTGHVRPATAKINSRLGCDMGLHNTRTTWSSRWSSTSASGNRGQFIANSREKSADQSREVWPWDVTSLRGLLNRKVGLHSSLEADDQAFCVPTGKEENEDEEQPYKRRVPPTRVDVEPLIAGIRERCIFPSNHATRLHPPWTAPPTYFSARVCHSPRERVGLAPLRLYKDFWEKWHKTHLFSELLSELRHDQRQRERLTLDEMRSQANRMHTMGVKERGCGLEGGGGGGGVAGSARNYALQQRIVRPCRSNKSLKEAKEHDAAIAFSQTYSYENVNGVRRAKETTTARRGMNSGGQYLQVPRPPAPTKATEERLKNAYRGRRVHPDNSTM